jgi:hypothetical protein
MHLSFCEHTIFYLQFEDDDSFVVDEAELSRRPNANIIDCKQNPLLLSESESDSEDTPIMMIPTRPIYAPTATPDGYLAMLENLPRRLSNASYDGAKITSSPSKPKVRIMRLVILCKRKIILIPTWHAIIYFDFLSFKCMHKLITVFVIFYISIKF